MKKLYSLTVTRKEEVEEISTNEEGQKVVEKKTVSHPIELIFKQPTRAELENMGEFNSIEISNCVRHGIMPRALLVKTYTDQGRIGFSKEEQEKYDNARTDLFHLESDYQNAILHPDDDDDAQTLRIDKIVRRILKAQDLIRDFEMRREDLFEHTAEAIARRRTIFWAVLYFLYRSVEPEDGKTGYEPVFKGDTADEKKTAYDRIVDNDEVLANAIGHMTIMISCWYSGAAGTQEEFEQIAQNLNSAADDDEEELDPPKEEGKNTED